MTKKAFCLKFRVLKIRADRMTDLRLREIRMKPIKKFMRMIQKEF